MTHAFYLTFSSLIYPPLPPPPPPPCTPVHPLSHYIRFFPPSLLFFISIFFVISPLRISHPPITLSSSSAVLSRFTLVLSPTFHLFTTTSSLSHVRTVQTGPARIGLDWTGLDCLITCSLTSLCHHREPASHESSRHRLTSSPYLLASLYCCACRSVYAIRSISTFTPYQFFFCCVLLCACHTYLDSFIRLSNPGRSYSTCIAI